MLLAAASPVVAHHDTEAQLLLLDESDPMPRWHSVVLEWEGTRTISGHETVINPHATMVRGGDQPMWGGGVVFEFQNPNGSWRWFAALTGHSTARGSSDARLTIRTPTEIDLEQGPQYRVETDNNTFAWILTGKAGRYRVTTWAAGEIEDGIYAFPLWGEPGVSLLGHTEGDTAHWIRADDFATVSAGGAVKNHGVWTRALASVNYTVGNLAYISDNAGPNACICRYTGPASGWNGQIKTGRSPFTFGGPAGTYQADVIMSYNHREWIEPSTLTRAKASYNDALSWVFADVTPPDFDPPQARIVSTGPWTGDRATFVSGEVRDASGMDAIRAAEDPASAAWLSASNGSYAIPVTLSEGDGQKTIAGEFRDALGNVARASTSIILDRLAPNVTPVSPEPDSPGNSILGLQVKGNWADDTSVTTQVSGVNSTSVQILWYDGTTGQTTDVTKDPRMSVTNTGFTYQPTVLPNTFYKVYVLKADRVGNWATSDWGFWTA
jgi:hypothetical protein